VSESSAQNFWKHCAGFFMTNSVGEPLLEKEFMFVGLLWAWLLKNTNTFCWNFTGVRRGRRKSLDFGGNLDSLVDSGWQGKRWRAVLAVMLLTWVRLVTRSALPFAVYSVSYEWALMKFYAGMAPGPSTQILLAIRFRIWI